MAVVVGSAWVGACVVAIAVAKRSERGFLLSGFLIAAIAMAIALYSARGLTDRPADTESAEYIELRNHSSSSLHVVSVDTGSRTTIRSGGRLFVQAEQASGGDQRMPGRSCPSDVTVSAGDGSTTFEVDGCAARARTVVTWDGSEAYSDPDGEPYVLDSRTSRVLTGFAAGLAALLVAGLVDRTPTARKESQLQTS